MICLESFALLSVTFYEINDGVYAKAADTEASRGQRGSGKLRIEAFLTLRILAAKVILQYLANTNGEAL